MVKLDLDFTGFRRFFVNIIILVVALFLLVTVGTLGLIYTLINSVINISKADPFLYFGNILYSINVGIDKIGNVLLGSFMNRFAIYEDLSQTKFGNINHTISYVLAKNMEPNTLRPLGTFLVNVLEYLDPGHMEKSLIINC